MKSSLSSCCHGDVITIVFFIADELDSFMFQTVGHEGVALYAEALCLPLYRGVTRGLSSVREKEYAPHPGDEVEDLYTLLARVKVRLTDMYHW